MGKPFKQELENIFETYQYCQSLNVDSLKYFFEKYNYPLYIVGSGGSLSACYFAASLAHQKGRFAKAITPLELISLKNTLKNSVVLFLSAGGKNNDIIYGFKEAIKEEPKAIASVCMKRDSPLAVLSRKYSISKIFEYDLPNGKDGFLATNSLVSFFTVLNKCFSSELSDRLSEDFQEMILHDINIFITKITRNFTINVLFNGWGQSVAVDIESKCTEAALCNTLVSDYRNFGHGRHHWFAKRDKNSAVLALITPKDEILAEKTLALIPSNIPKLIIKSNCKNSLASIELLLKSFYFIDKLGEMQGIDPGKPGVPVFGRKLYNLNFITSLKDKKTDNLSTNAIIAIKRKTNVNSINELSRDEIQFWHKAFINYVQKLNNSSFGCLVFDYDGTLCNAENRYSGPSTEIVDKLIKILSHGFIISIITGRGKSVRNDMQKAIPKELWGNVIIGYYNGSDIGFLYNDKLPNKDLPNNKSLLKISKLIDSSKNMYRLEQDLRPNQLTLTIKNKENWENAKSYVLHLINVSAINDTQFLESSHSIDIIPNTISKIGILDFCKNRATELGIPTNCLCIGDKGQWPGNDYKLLSTEYSLSVEETSLVPNNCWNLASNGIRNSEATLEYLQYIKLNNTKMTIKLPK
jgi:hydroxymethylpyrimidine pyrophosphatase-like HAD family hydrolase/Ca2+-binding EF-hand superfamily protein